MKSCAPTTVPPAPNVASGLKESTNQRPSIRFIVPVYWIESDLDRADPSISSNSTSFGEAWSAVQSWKVVPTAGYG